MTACNFKFEFWDTVGSEILPYLQASKLVCPCIIDASGRHSPLGQRQESGRLSSLHCFSISTKFHPGTQRASGMEACGAFASQLTNTACEIQAQGKPAPCPWGTDIGLRNGLGWEWTGPCTLSICSKYSKSSLNVMDRFWETTTLSKSTYNETNFTISKLILKRVKFPRHIPGRKTASNFYIKTQNTSNNNYEIYVSYTYTSEGLIKTNKNYFPTRLSQVRLSMAGDHPGAQGSPWTGHPSTAGCITHPLNYVGQCRHASHLKCTSLRWEENQSPWRKRMQTCRDRAHSKQTVVPTWNPFPFLINIIKKCLAQWHWTEMMICTDLLRAHGCSAHMEDCLPQLIREWILIQKIS